MLRSFISRSTEQEPAFRVKPWCLETGTRAGRFETILSKCLHAACESKLGVLTVLHSEYLLIEALFYFPVVTWFLQHMKMFSTWKTSIHLLYC